MASGRARRLSTRRDYWRDGDRSRGGRVDSEPQFPHCMHNAAMVYASSASPNMVACEGHPGHHVPAARNLAATSDDESYHGSTSKLPPATSHGYAEWDFSGVPDPVMFHRFLDAAITGSATPTTPASGATTPRGSASS
jgi:hypothetical protein